MATSTDHAPLAPEPVPNAPGAPAGGGLAVVALFAACGHLGLELVSNFLPVVYPILVAEAGFSFAQVGTVTLVATLGMTLPQPLFGMLVRRFDAGRLVIAAVLWCGLFYGLAGLAGSYWPLLAAVALGGLGSALFHPAGSVVAAAARSRRRGAAMSIFSVGGNAGAALSPLLMAAMIGWYGLGGTLVTIPVAAATALLLLLLARHGAVPAAATSVTPPGLRRRRTVDAKSPQSPAGTEAAHRRERRRLFARAGVPAAPLGGTPVPMQQLRDPKATGGRVEAMAIAPAGACSGAGPKVDGEARRDHRLRHRPPATLGIGAAVCALGLIVLFAMARAWYQVSLTTYLPLWVAQHDGARVGIAQVLFVLAGSLPAGAVLGGALSDRVGRWQVVLASCLLLVPANTALLAVGPGGAPGALLTLTAAIGCLIGATYPVAIIIAQEAWPRNIGLAGGMIMGLGWLPGGVGASAVGLLADDVGLERALATQVVPLLVGVVSVTGYAVLNRRTRLSDRGTPVF